MTPFSLIDACFAGFAASMPSFSVSGDRREPCQLSGLGIPVSLSCRHFLIGDMATRDGIHEAGETFKRVPSDVARIQAECKFVNVTTEMLPAAMVIDAMQPAPQNSPHALDTVHRDGAASVFARRVVHRIMLKKETVQIGVSDVLISVKLTPNFDIGVNRLVNFLDGPLLERECQRLRPARAFPVPALYLPLRVRLSVFWIRALCARVRR